MASSFFASITLKCKLYRSPDNLCKPINVNCIQHNACGNPVEAYKPTQTPLLLGAPYREALVVIYRHYCYPAEEKGCSHSIAISDKTARRPWVTDSIKEPPRKKKSLSKQRNFFSGQCQFYNPKIIVQMLRSTIK